MSIQDQISEELKTAMRNKDAVRLSCLRLIKTEIAKAEANIGDRLDATGAINVLKKMAKQRRDSIEQFRAANRTDLADKEEAELHMIESYLPASISAEEIDRVIDETLAEVGPADEETTTGVIVGRTINKLKATGLPFDGREVSDRVLKRLKP